MDVRTFVSDGAGPTHRYEGVNDARSLPSIPKDGGRQQQAHARKPLGERKGERVGARDGNPSYVSVFFCNVDTVV